MSAGRRAWLTWSVKIAFSLALFAFLVRKVGFTTLTAELNNANYGWLAAGLAMGLIAASITVTQWWGLLNAVGLSRTWRHCAHLELAGDAFDAAFPSAIGGDVMRAVWVSSDPEERSPAVLSVFLRRVANLPGLAIIMVVGLLGSLSQPHVRSLLPFVELSLVFVVGVVGVLVLFGRRRRTRAGRRASRGRHGRDGKFSQTVRGIAEGVSQVSSQPMVLLRAAATGTCFWLAVVASQWCYLRAFGVELTVFYACLAVTLVNIASMLPISLGGYGLREGAFGALVAFTGTATAAQGAAGGLCVSAQTVLLGVVGVGAYLLLPKRMAPSRHAVLARSAV
jgi:glycosyltransferase 2 family protein